MGFPTWTLWGMGLAALGALVSILLAFIAQTPRLLARLGLVGARLDLRARTFTGYGLAFLLLAGGFFLAGVPLGNAEPSMTSAQIQEEAQGIPATAAPETAAQPVAQAPGDTAGDDAAASVAEAIAVEPAATGSGASSGMVVRPRETEPADAIAEATPADTEAQPTDTPAPTQAAAAPAGAPPTTTSTPSPQPSATATPSPTATPTPTMTPTPIDGATARVGENASALPVRDKPNGEPIATVYRGDTLLLLPGRAFHTGGLWREISTVDGIVGWVQDVFLDYGG